MKEYREGKQNDPRFSYIAIISSFKLTTLKCVEYPLVYSGHMSAVLGNTDERHRHGTDNRPKVIVTV